ncbi:hypothetical protein [Rhodoblastus sp.]|uniref:hypothetical protein n=1 Tax=Rhodoblastus sp. TaxID=1962975 RepID=UPI0025F2CCD1|nr:hypothetical protein [Rhodoblastus sp.]
MLRRPFHIIGKASSLRVAVALACALVSAPRGWTAGIESCEKIKDADAYNSCLASYGPAVGEHRFTRAPAAENEAEPLRRGEHKAGAGKIRASKSRASKPVAEAAHGPKRQANGRVRIEIFPGR